MLTNNQKAIKNREHRQRNYSRRNRAYNIVKLLATREGFMKHQRDTEGLDRYMNSFNNDEIDWFEAINQLQKK